MRPALLGLNTEELRNLVQQKGERAFRGNQIAEWLYRHGVHTFKQMTDLPGTFRTTLAATYRIGRGNVIARRQSHDGTVKLLLSLDDGALIETVGLPYADRTSCCISTQVGCPVSCVFCATGLSGFSRNLTAGEIIDQVLAMQEEMRQRACGEGRDRIDHVTFMGMGEPLLNYEATVRAVQLLNGEMGIAMRNLTISTAGLVPGIRRLANERLQLTLAISLHAPTDELRHRLVPGMRKWSVADIVAACQYYVEQTSRRVTFEYCLLDGVNDRPEDATQLATLLRGLNSHVNLIPFNTVQWLGFRKPPRERIKTFRAILESAGIRATQRVQRGSRIDAACGQLRRVVNQSPGLKTATTITGMPPGQ